MHISSVCALSPDLIVRLDVFRYSHSYVTLPVENLWNGAAVHRAAPGWSQLSLSNTIDPVVGMPSLTRVNMACLCECVEISQNLLSVDTLHVCASRSSGPVGFGGML